MLLESTQSGFCKIADVSACERLCIYYTLSIQQFNGLYHIKKSYYPLRYFELQRHKGICALCLTLKH